MALRSGIGWRRRRLRCGADRRLVGRPPVVSNAKTLSTHSRLLIPRANNSRVFADWQSMMAILINSVLAMVTMGIFLNTLHQVNRGGDIDLTI